ncbi:hypothetical protein HKCCSP123_05215 [Rhodobacterales bacterium HKCCSP123]|nr:hypothetical protein [Rhodobacterales bacterium HKCCSP123]
MQFTKMRDGVILVVAIEIQGQVTKDARREFPGRPSLEPGGKIPGPVQEVRPSPVNEGHFSIGVLGQCSKDSVHTRLSADPFEV